jgi:hypothetical protein
LPRALYVLRVDHLRIHIPFDQTADNLSLAASDWATSNTLTLLSAHHTRNVEIFNVDLEITTLPHETCDEDIASFAKLHEDPSNNEQIGIYIFACILIFTTTLSVEYLEHAIQQIEGWIAASPTDHSDRSRRFQVLDVMLARVAQDRLMLEVAIPNSPGIG